MKYALAALTALVSIASLTYATQAAASNRGLLADLPCPYGGAGNPNPLAWGPTTGSSPFNPGAPTANAATLVAGSNEVVNPNQDGLAFTAATQYVWYTNPIPNATTNCGSNQAAPDPIEQVINYTLASGSNGGLTLASGDHEILFNYNTAENPTLASTAGVASFTMGGITYTSTGSLLPTSTDNDFLFDSTGKLLGALTLDANGDAVLTANAIPTGWTSSSGGGGTVSAPEIDLTLAISGFTLLAGFLAVLRGQRRTVNVDSSR
jgi:hypothetical protein